MSPYQQLAFAIVGQAVMDYRRALEQLAKNPANTLARQRKSRLEEFFRSPWYQILTPTHGDYMIYLLQQEVAHDCKNVSGTGHSSGRPHPVPAAGQTVLKTAGRQP